MLARDMEVSAFVPPIIDKEGEVKDLLKSIAKDLREADNIDKEQLATAFDKLGELLGNRMLDWSACYRR